MENKRYIQVNWETDFIEWDNAGHSNASQRDIINWFKERLLPEPEVEAKTIDEMLKGCEHDGSFIPVSEVKRLMEEYAQFRSQPEMPIDEEEIDLSNPDYHHDCVECGNSFWNKTKDDTICESCKSSVKLNKR